MTAGRPAGSRSPVRVLLGVTGGIAAYKSLELVRLFRKTGWQVRVVMTASALKLVGRESFSSLSGHPVATDLFPRRRLKASARIDHIDLAAWADLVLVAPATANIIGKLAAGVADDLLSTLLLAVPGPLLRAGRVVLAPAMNTNMWQHPSVLANVRRLRGLGYRLVEPDAGELACGDTGKGRLPQPELLFRVCQDALSRTTLPDLTGTRALVTTGRTEEPIDPVRVITNRSSGRMGIEIAAALRTAGADVRLVAGQLSVPLPTGVDITRVRTTDEMRDVVLERIDSVDLLVMCAAVADYRPARVSRTKHHSSRVSLALAKTADILKDVSKARQHAVVIGFSLDPSPEAARRKLKAKKLDLIVANPLTTPDSEAIRPTLVRPGRKPQALRSMPKPEFARRLVAESGRLLAARSDNA